MMTLKGKSFKTESKLVFRVLADQHYPAEQIAPAHQSYLNSLREGQLVSVTFYGYPVPVVTVKDGVVKLKVVETSGQRLKGSYVISSLLGVAKTRHPVKVTRV